MVILQLAQFHKKTLVGIEQEIVAEKNKDDIIIEGDTRSLNNSESVELKEWLKNTLAPKIKNIKVIIHICFCFLSNSFATISIIFFKDK